MGSCRHGYQTPNKPPTRNLLRIAAHLVAIPRLGAQYERAADEETAAQTEASAVADAGQVPGLRFHRTVPGLALYAGFRSTLFQVWRDARQAVSAASTLLDWARYVTGQALSAGPERIAHDWQGSASAMSAWGNSAVQVTPANHETSGVARDQRELPAHGKAGN